MTEDHAAEPGPSRTWAGIVDSPTFERFADAWQLHAEADEPSAVTEHEHPATHIYTFDGMNWEDGGESPVVYVTVEVAVVRAGNKAEAYHPLPAHLHGSAPPDALARAWSHAYPGRSDSLHRPVGDVAGGEHRANAHDARRPGEIDLLIVDDHHAARYSVWALLSWKRDIRVTGTANSSAEALTLAKRRRPHACLISATLGQGEALTLASRMKHLIDPPRVLIFADAVDQHLACAATVAGADGVLCRYADPEEQAGVVRRVASGEQQFPDLQPSEIHALLDQVEDRDRAIVAMLLEHTPPDHIAGLLGISARSLELRRQGILKRLGPTCGVDDRHQDGREHRDPVATAGSRETRRQMRPVRLSARSFREVTTRCHGSSGLAAGAQPPDPPTASIRNRARPPSRDSSHPRGLRSRAGLAPWPH